MFPEKVRAKQVFQTFSHNQLPGQLPYPLSCMNRKEKITWITKEILRDQREKSGELFHSVKYGDVDLVPSFWPNEEWDWQNLTKNLSNMTNSSYTGPGNFQDFITRLIVKCIRAAGENLETFVDENMDKKKLKRRMKNHGIHEESHIIDDDVIEGSETNNQRQETEAHESEYRFPCNPPSQESTTFIPRRKLPDDLSPTFPSSGPIPTTDRAQHDDAPSYESGPLPPTATPVDDDTTFSSPSPQPQPCNDNAYMSQIIQPDLTEADFDYDLSGRDIVDPPQFLLNIPDPLDPGWKVLENADACTDLVRIILG